MFYLFPLVLPITKGNVFKTFIIGLVVLVIGVYFVTNLAPAFTLAAQDVYAMTQDAAVKIPDGFDYAASLDFASSPFAWIIYHLVISIKYVGPAALVLFTGFMVWVNHRRIVKLNQENNNEINKQI